MREVTGGTSPFLDRVRARVEAELKATHQAEIEALKAEYEQRLAETATATQQELHARVRDQLMRLAGFQGGAAAPSPSNG